MDKNSAPKDFESLIKDSIALIAQTPTGKELVEKVKKLKLNIRLDFSLPPKTPMQTHENGVSVAFACLSPQAEGLFLDSLAHELSHAVLIPEADTFKTKHNVTDELYKNNLDEAKAVSTALQIGAELKKAGLNSSMSEYQNGADTEFDENIVHYNYHNALKAFNGSLESNPTSLENGTAMKSGFMARLTEDRADAKISKVYESDRINYFAYMGKEISLQLMNKPQTPITLANNANKFPFLKATNGLTERDIAPFGEWCGKNILADKKGSLAYMLTDDAKTKGLAPYITTQIKVAELNMSQAQTTYKMCEYKVASAQQSIQKAFAYR